jgi:proteasome accessory factor B
MNGVQDSMHQRRVARLRRLERLLPGPTTRPAECMPGPRLLEILGDAYPGESLAAQQRALQRDLAALVEQGRIEAVDPQAKPRRYRRSSDGLEDDALIRGYTLQQMRDLVAEAIPSRRLERVWQRLIHEFDVPLLDEQRLRVVPDTIRLEPPYIDAAVLQTVITALAERRVLQAVYRNSNGERSTPTLHAQALVQRGPMAYLLALKNDEDLIRLYAVNRFVSAALDPDSVLRVASHFDLDQAIADGRVDFGRGEMIELELRVRGYLSKLLRDCSLGTGQVIEEEPEGSGFDLRLRTRVPQTGQLLRWLLGAGPNVEVLAPARLRAVVANQAMRTATLYPAPES